MKLLEYFVLEVTARSAADLLEIQANSAILFYRKIREVIAAYLEDESKEIFDGAVELDDSYFGTIKVKPQLTLKSIRMNLLKAANKIEEIFTTTGKIRL